MRTNALPARAGGLAPGAERACGSNTLGSRSRDSCLHLDSVYPMGYSSAMVFQIKQTDEFRDWLARLRDIKARARIEARIDLLGKGNAGDSAPVGAGVSEMR